MKVTAGELVAVAVAVCAAAGIGLTQQGTLAKHAHTARTLQVDIEPLPPPGHLKRLVLGYRSAAVDYLWVKVLVEQGIHMQEKRRFESLPSYIDGIIALEPDFRSLYEFVDTLLLFQFVPGEEKDARLARRYLERGLQERPYDHKIWLHYGQYVAFLAPSYLTDKAEIEQWRKDGALAIMRAVELGADSDRSLAAATILRKAGEQKAAIAHLQRSYALANDPETRRQIKGHLERLQAKVEAESTVDAVEQEWRGKFPFLSRGTALLLGPHRAPLRCAGTGSTRNDCPAAWTDIEQ
ncbi:MAG: hypothetical protein KIT84_23530 [Labilithrix sp.]|nr:hypothetical protein [Labilithrix sp.]MCW5814020.1 hypothetical protein [Labilithrix sp.]